MKTLMRSWSSSLKNRWERRECPNRFPVRAIRFRGVIFFFGAEWGRQVLGSVDLYIGIMSFVEWTPWIQASCVGTVSTLRTVSTSRTLTSLRVGLKTEINHRSYCLEMRHGGPSSRTPPLNKKKKTSTICNPRRNAEITEYTTVVQEIAPSLFTPDRISTLQLVLLRLRSTIVEDGIEYDGGVQVGMVRQGHFLRYLVWWA